MAICRVRKVRGKDYFAMSFGTAGVVQCLWSFLTENTKIIEVNKDPAQM
jgi:hypothetical protein